MLGLKYAAAAAVVTITILILSATAEANPPRCGFDRYGYHPPDFRGCYVVEPAPVYVPVYSAPRVYRAPRARHVRHIYRGVRPVHRYRPKVAVRYLPAPPPPPPHDGYYAAGYPAGPGCYYDNGYDMVVHHICYGR